MDNTKHLTNKVFTEYVETMRLGTLNEGVQTEGIVTSSNEFFELVCKASNIYCQVNKTPESDKLVFAEEYPHDLVANINNKALTSTIDANTLRDLRIVTYTLNEKPAILSSRRPDERTGIQNIKWRLIDTYEDPEYTGYSIARIGKDLEAEITFRVWGINFYDIRKRSLLLRDVIDTNVWFFKHKGLRDIIWLDSAETNLWDGKSIVKERTERYLIRFTQVKLTREKNLEQLVLQIGIKKD